MTARPPGCCGGCPPLARGGYDCTCRGNVNCSARIKVQAVRAANGRIQGWAINRGNQELDFYYVSLRVLGEPTAHALAMAKAQRIARG